MQAIEGARRVLLLWIGRVGDLLVTTPFFSALKARFPEAEIRLVTGEKGLEAAGLCPGLDEILALRPFHRPWANLRLACSLAAWPADLLVDCNTSFSRASWTLASLARARVKLAFAKGRGDGAYTQLLPAPAETEHMLDRYHRLAAALGAPYEARLRVGLTPGDEAEAADMLKGLDRGGRALVGVHAGNFKKFDNRWPEEKFVQLTQSLQDRPDVRIVYLAGPGEEPPVRALASRLKTPVRVLGPKPLRVFAALIKGLDLFVGNVTGTAHLAVAVGTPTLTLRSRYTHTIWMPRPQDKCGEHYGVVADSWTSCRDIPVDAAMRALEGALSKLGRPRRLGSPGR